MTGELEGRTVPVTGGRTGIGRAATRELGAELGRRSAERNAAPV